MTNSWCLVVIFAEIPERTLNVGLRAPHEVYLIDLGFWEATSLWEAARATLKLAPLSLLHPITRQLNP